MPDASGPRHECRMVLQPDPLEVRRVMEALRDDLHDVMAADPLSTIELVGAEILNNVVEHAFADGRAGSIELTTVVAGGQFTLRVVDDGHPMPGHAPPNPGPRDIDPDDIMALPEGGFGWSLIQMLSGQVNYSYLDGKNHLEVTISI